ncbi:extracellular solute-binding protein [Vallitalea guaymasensis]|uniref:Extracellular solute-binding protein n=1 Tax=Vallitalea guaymasensis TaxID=1185412 RepID=A0A8J8M9W2_9FIRM|nr:extracellular solute-binding protein [Vallitalea guaymasensis]QUH28800.1 extracellular solute-binding protein [Vallitalea guaymasensis]
MKKLLSILLVTVLTLGVFTGCGNKEEKTVDTNDKVSEETTNEPIELRYQIVWDINSGRGKNIQSVVDMFNESNENIKVSLITGDSDEKKLITSLLSDDTAELIQLSVKSVKTIGKEGLLRDLTEYKNDYSELFYDELLNFFQYEDKLFAAPWIGHTIELVYNKDLFEAAGLTQAPSTWDEVLEYSKIIEEKTDAKGLGIAGMQNNDAIWMSTPIIKSYGGEFITEEDGKQVMAINNDEGIKGLEIYQQIAKNYDGAAEKNGGNVMEDFRNQKIAMEFQGPWGVTDIWKNNNPFEVNAALIPAGPAGRFVDGGPYGIAIPASTSDEKAGAAIQFINYLQSTEAQAKIMEGEYDEKTDNYYPYRVPMRKDMKDSEYFVEHPELLVFIEGLEHVIDSFPSPEFNQIANEVITVELNKLASGETTPDQAAKTMEEKGNEILKNIQ